MYCKCHNILHIDNAIKDIAEEVKEFLSSPSKDELSDIAYGMNRLIGAFFKMKYIKLIPGDGIHIKKIELRMQEYGCIRSERYLINNKCPSNE